MKKFISLFTCLILCFSVCFISNATDTHHSSTASYDLEKGGKQELTLVNSEGCTMYITIEQDTSRTVANGTYKVSARHSNNAWKAGYQVTVKNNTITTLSSPYVDTALGSAQNLKLKLETSKQGILHFTWKHLLLSINYGVRTTLTSSSLKVTVILQPLHSHNKIQKILLVSRQHNCIC